jgi:hypothetical protein
MDVSVTDALPDDGSQSQTFNAMASPFPRLSSAKPSQVTLPGTVITSLHATFERLSFHDDHGIDFQQDPSYNHPPLSLSQPTINSLDDTEVESRQVGTDFHNGDFHLFGFHGMADDPFNTEPAGENEATEVLFSNRPPPSEQVNSNSPERTRKPRESIHLVL